RGLAHVLSWCTIFCAAASSSEHERAWAWSCYSGVTTRADWLQCDARACVFSSRVASLVARSLDECTAVFAARLCMFGSGRPGGEVSRLTRESSALDTLRRNSHGHPSTGRERGRGR
ncbi:uncharacterized protein C8Q71DRAFT_782714, partial [Rhodofomes roseus]